MNIVLANSKNMKEKLRILEQYHFIVQKVQFQ